MKLISIAGSGRSGSTFLSLLLTQNDDIFNLGQLRDFWQAYSNNAACSCGEPLSACAFWSQVTQLTFGASAHHGLTEMHHLMVAFNKDAETIPDWTNDHAVKRLAQNHSIYLDRLGKFLSATKAIAKVNAFLETSKSPEIALAFSLVQGVELRVLNLVRDPRAVACSWERKKNFQMAVLQTHNWARRQRILAQWSLALGNRFLRIRYEDLTQTPQASIKYILAWAELKPTPGLFTSEHHAELSWARQHLFPPANETVLAEKRTSMDVILASEWRRPENHSTHQMVEIQVGDLMEKLGYQKGSL